MPKLSTAVFGARIDPVVWQTPVRRGNTPSEQDLQLARPRGVINKKNIMGAQLLACQSTIGAPG